jgi:hypothetical protein
MMAEWCLPDYGRTTQQAFARAEDFCTTQRSPVKAMFLGGTMSIKLPAPVSDYLVADAQKDLDKLSRCFTKDATVHDENQEYQGLEAIKSWKEQTTAKYQYVVEPMRTAVTEKNVRLHARLTGNFPGSPAEVDYTFVLDNGKIASLDIR